ncbi:MAG: hypothetical protein EPN98_21740 [Phenylobacterium sp.]|uniref:hypothetical protein n=1 Tax=Phenylobacterium sp. TaxID=1871053 RepID=UPI0012108258|nr:hypothetical protein [Phenylobacterium sp.]TAL29067.1 MAG: hypothetical protein EPN98_21740 [Phenylobacterium sp.]
MLALTLFDPWAQLCIIGAEAGGKGIETRGWAAPVWARGRIAIHSSKAFKREDVDTFFSPGFREVFEAAGFATASSLPRGCIIGTVFLAGCYPVELLTAKWPEDARERRFGNYTPGRWGWVLKDPIRLREPVPCRGLQKLWTIPSDVLSRIPESARYSTEAR